MSNFSDPMAALLAGMAAEWRRLAKDIAGLAELAGKVSAPDDAMLTKLQAFDATLQNVEAQARLLHALSQERDATALIGLLDDHPLPQVRARLKASLGVPAAIQEADGGAVHFFPGAP